MKNKNILSIFLSVIIFSCFFVFVGMAHAQGSLVIPCDGADCDFNKLVELGSNVMTFLILLSIPIATVAFAYAGFLMLTAQGSEGQVEHGKEIFKKVLIGFIFVLSAWLIVKTITGALLKEDSFIDFLTVNYAQPLEQSSATIEV